MERKTTAPSPSTEPSVGSTKAKANGHSSRNKKNDDLEDARSHPERIDVHMTVEDVQDTTNLGMPDAIHVRPPSSDPIQITEESAALPIAAHVAPDAADMEAVLEERWAARMAQGIEERTRRERNQTREVPLVNDDDIVVVVDDMKEVGAHPGQKKQFQWILAIMVLLLVVGGVVAFLLLRDKDDKQVEGSEALSQSDAPSEDPSQAPSFSPVPVDPLVEELRSWIAPTREDLLRFLDSSSPQSQALAWLQDDPITLTPGRSTATVLERYVLAVLYYSTSGPSWQVDYMSDEDVCTWNNGKPAPNYTLPCLEDWSCEFLEGKGVYCVEDGESIGTLALSEYNLQGPLPWELALLTSLEVLDVGLNSLTGSIPTRIMNLTSLEVLIIYLNFLSGSIPAEISQLTSLEVFWASFVGFTGTLPATFSPSLVELDLSGNSLTGPIPDSWWTTMPELTFIYMPENRLTGSLPSSFDGLSNLLYLVLFDNLLTGRLPTTFPASATSIHLDKNAFTGSIPSTWGGSMPDLWGLSLQGNALTGTIPSSLFSGLTDLYSFDVGDNSLSGPLPTSFPASIEVVNLENNALTGTIPSSWGDSMPNLGSLAINGNSLNGTVPFSLGEITTLYALALQKNALTGSIPLSLDHNGTIRVFTFYSNLLTGSADFLCNVDTWTFLEADCPEPVTCSCCTTCHDAT